MAENIKNEIEEMPDIQTVPETEKKPVRIKSAATDKPTKPRAKRGAKAAEKKEPEQKQEAEVKDTPKKSAGRKTRKTQEKKKILFVSSEAAPFITTGGLGEVIGALPQALYDASDDVDVRVILPLYDEISKNFKNDALEFLGKIYVDLGWRHQYCGIFSAKVGQVTYYFIDNEYYFKRADCYGHFDDGERFAFYGKAVLDILGAVDFIPDIIHTHDWQCALVSIYLRTIYRHREAFKNIKTIFTIHNMEYQGKYDLSILYDIFDIPYEYMNIVEFNGGINLMKGAITCSDIISTVSESYAKEIHDFHFAHGLEPIINMETRKIRGILNGIDIISYNPETDEKISKNYNAENISDKYENKYSLQAIMDMQQNDSVPIIAIITRLVNHKGIDLILAAMNEIMAMPIQFVVLGKGDRHFEAAFEAFREKYPDKIGVKIGFNNEIARRVYAGADMLIMPSKFEPCGITQMIGARYGTIPLVRETGGLRDSIEPYAEGGKGNGFTFYDSTKDQILDLISRAVAVYNNKEEWNALVKRAMEWDFSWKVSAVKYLKMYDEIIDK